MPDSRDYNFTDTLVEITMIPGSADTVVIHFNVGQTGIEVGGSQVDPVLEVASAIPASAGVDFVMHHAGGSAVLEVFDLSGRMVSRLVDEVLPAGSHAVSWVSANAPAGVYIARFTSSGVPVSRKIVMAGSI